MVEEVEQPQDECVKALVFVKSEPSFIERFERTLDEVVGVGMIVARLPQRQTCSRNRKYCLRCQTKHDLYNCKEQRTPSARTKPILLEVVPNACEHVFWAVFFSFLMRFPMHLTLEVVAIVSAEFEYLKSAWTRSVFRRCFLA